MKELVHRQSAKKHKKEKSMEEKQSFENEQDAEPDTSRFKMFKRKKGNKAADRKKEKKNEKLLLK